MKKRESEGTVFVVEREGPLPGLSEWASERPALLGDGFEELARRVPLPEEGEIPLVGVLACGDVIVVDALEEEEKADLSRIARGVSFIRSRPDWIRSMHSGQGRIRTDRLRLVVLAERFPPTFVQALGGLAVEGFRLLRVRLLENAEGNRVLLVEEERGACESAGSTERFPGLDPEESAFFRRVREEQEALRSREEAG